MSTTENNSLRDFDPYVRDVDGEIVGFKPIRTSDFGVKDIAEMPAPKPGQGAKI